MKNILILCTCLLMSTASYANFPSIDSDIAHVRTSCNEGGNPIDNCFETIELLELWIEARAKTTPLPALVNIGPGTFDRINCNYSGVTFRGAGRDNTVIYGQVAAFNSVSGCNNINVENIKLIGSNYGVHVTNSQELHSTWTNVEIISGAYAWLEDITSCVGSDRGEHRFFSSRLTADNTPNHPLLPDSIFNKAEVYGANCGKTWIYNSELTVISPVLPDSLLTIAAWFDSEVHVYGSNLRLIADSYTYTGIPHGMITSQEGSEIHIHGTGIDVISENAIPVNVLVAKQGSSIHANESAYAIHNPGVTTRISGSGVIKAPYTWEQSVESPFNIVSVTGADTFIETDCDASGDCSGNGLAPLRPHMMIYDSSCNTNSHWYDTVTNECRQ